IKKKINIYNFDNSSNKVHYKQTNIIEEENSEKQDVIKVDKLKTEFPPMENFVNFKESGNIPSFLINK
ncbi:MAG: hypothetical protein ACKVHI_10180, partial [Candidatus Puniceispirillales bacterium]